METVSESVKSSNNYLEKLINLVSSHNEISRNGDISFFPRKSEKLQESNARLDKIEKSLDEFDYKVSGIYGVLMKLKKFYESGPNEVVNEIKKLEGENA